MDWGLRALAAALGLATLLSGCGSNGGGGDDPAQSARCKEAKASAEDNQAKYRSADAEASTAKADYVAAQAEVQALAKKTRETGVSTFNEITAPAARSREAEAQFEAASAMARTNGRLFAQIIIGESECFTPEQVASAREVLSATE